MDSRTQTNYIIDHEGRLDEIEKLMGLGKWAPKEITDEMVEEYSSASSYPDLKTMAGDLELDTTGKKTDLARRILEHQEANK